MLGRMALAVCLLFDARGERLMRELWARLEEQGIPTLQTHTHGLHHPHFSYAVLLDWDLDDVMRTLSNLPDGGPFSLAFHGTVAFPRGRAAIVPSVSADVMRRQEAVSAALGRAGATVHHSYEPGSWIPHCSLSPRASGRALLTVAKAVADVLPLPVEASRAALIDSGTGEVWPLSHIP